MNHVSSVLVFANFQRVLSKGSRPGLGTQADQVTRGGRSTEVTSDVQWGVVINILLVEHFFEEEFCLTFEVAHNLVVVAWRDKLLELIQNMHATSRVISILSVLKVLELHKKTQELLKSINLVNMDLKESLESLCALGELIHCSKVQGVAL